MARRERLTKTAVDGLDAGRADSIVWDVDVPRFGVRVRPSGAKHYVLRLRVEGKQRWYAIGKHGDPWTPDTARDEARRVLGQAENVKALRRSGSAPPDLLHPVEARQRAKVAPTVAEFAKRYLTDHAIPFKAPATLEADRGLLGLREGKETKPRTILAALGNNRMDRLTHADVVAFHLSWKDTPTRANRALALLSNMFAKAGAWGVRHGANPCKGVDRFAEKERERFLSGKELARLGAALAAVGQENKLTPFGLAAIKLLIFTGARASEVLGLTWDAVNLAAGSVRLQESKTGRKTIYFPPPAAAVFKSLPRLKGNPHVIPGAREGEQLTLSGLEQVWQVVRDRAELSDVRLHDLRHSFASVAASGGASLPVIGALLGHSQAQTTMRYAHLLGHPLKVAAGAVGQRIAAAMRPRSTRRNVSPLRRGKR